MNTKWMRDFTTTLLLISIAFLVWLLFTSASFSAETLSGHFQSAQFYLYILLPYIILLIVARTATAHRTAVTNGILSILASLSVALYYIAIKYDALIFAVFPAIQVVVIILAFGVSIGISIAMRTLRKG